MSLWYLIRFENKEDENGKTTSREWCFCGIHFKPERAVEVAKKYIATIAPHENAEIKITKFDDKWYVEYSNKDKVFVTYQILKTELEEEKDTLITGIIRNLPIVWD